MSSIRMQIVYWLLPLLILVVVSCSPGGPSPDTERTEAPRVQPATLTQPPPPTLAPTGTPFADPTTLLPSPTLSPTPSVSPTPDLVAQDLPLADVSYRLPLTLRHVTDGTATLFFELSVPAAGRLLLQPEAGSGPGVEKVLVPGQSRHLITFEGLHLEPAMRPLWSWETCGRISKGLISRPRPGDRCGFQLRQNLVRCDLG